jgi:hypothetical protein
MSEEEFKKKLLILQVMVGMHLKVMGDTLTHLCEVVSNYSTDEEHVKKVEHFKNSQEVFDRNTAMAMGLMSKLHPELIEQMFPVEH